MDSEFGGSNSKTRRGANNLMEDRLAVRYATERKPEGKQRDTAVPVKTRFARRGKLVHILAVIALIGAVVIITDLLSRKSGGGPTVDFRNQQATMEDWYSTGFVKSLDDSTGTVIVNEGTWGHMTRDRKMGAALFLRAYYSTRNSKQLRTLTVKGDVTHDVLVRIVLPTSQ